MLRPIYLLATNHPLSNRGASSGTGAYAHQSSAGGTKLATIAKTQREIDEDGDSTYKLAGSEHRGGSISEGSEYHAHDGQAIGPNTIITGRERGEGEEVDERWAGVGGIVVTNEIGVRVSRAK